MQREGEGGSFVRGLMYTYTRMQPASGLHKKASQRAPHVYTHIHAPTRRKGKGDLDVCHHTATHTTPSTLTQPKPYHISPPNPNQHNRSLAHTHTSPTSNSNDIRLHCVLCNMFMVLLKLISYTSIINTLITHNTPATAREANSSLPAYINRHARRRCGKERIYTWHRTNAVECHYLNPVYKRLRYTQSASPPYAGADVSDCNRLSTYVGETPPPPHTHDELTRGAYYGFRCMPLPTPVNPY